MSIDIKVKDGREGTDHLKIDHNGSALTTPTGVPPENLDAILKPFASFLTDENGSDDMRVSGTLAAPIDFSIGSSSLGDRYIQTLTFTIADAGAALNEFGAITALTNGCQLIYQNDRLGDVIIGEALQSNFDFVQICNFEPSFGTGTSSFRASNVQGASEAFVPLLDLTDVFGLPYGVQIPQNSKLKLLLRVRDNTTAIDRFDVKAFGFDRISLA